MAAFDGTSIRSRLLCHRPGRLGRLCHRPGRLGRDISLGILSSTFASLGVIGSCRQATRSWTLGRTTRFFLLFLCLAVGGCLFSVTAGGLGRPPRFSRRCLLCIVLATLFGFLFALVGSDGFGRLGGFGAPGWFRRRTPVGAGKGSIAHLLSIGDSNGFFARTFGCVGGRRRLASPAFLFLALGRCLAVGRRVECHGIVTRLEWTSVKVFGAIHRTQHLGELVFHFRLRHFGLLVAAWFASSAFLFFLSSGGSNVRVVLKINGYL